jgi:hypothetical protein
MTHLLTVVALDLGPVLRLRAIAGEMASLFAVTAKSSVRVLGLVAVLGHVLGRVAVAAGPGGNVGTL